MAEWPLTGNSSSTALRQTDKCRIERALVTRGRVHVALLCSGGDRAPPTAHWNERAVAALLLVRRQPIEIRGGRDAGRLLASVDVADRLRDFAAEAGARIQAAVDADGVRVLAMNLARAHVDAVWRVEPALARLVAQELHLLVDEVAGVAHARALRLARARSRNRDAGAAQRLVALAANGQRDDYLRRRRGHANDRLEVDLRNVLRELLLGQEVDQCRIAPGRGLVEVPPDRDGHLRGDLAHVLEDLVERPLAASKRPHAVVRLAVPVERDLDAVEAVREQAIDDLGREQQSVGDDVDEDLHSARARGGLGALRDQVDHRPVEERFTTDEAQDDLFRLYGVRPHLV